MKQYRKKGSIKAVQFNRDGYRDLMADKEKFDKQSEELKLLVKRIRHTPNGYFCASSAGQRPIENGSWLCYDEGRVFTMSDESFKGKFEEVTGGTNEELIDQQQAMQEEIARLEELLSGAQEDRNRLQEQLNDLHASIDAVQEASKDTPPEAGAGTDDVASESDQASALPEEISGNTGSSDSATT